MNKLPLPPYSNDYFDTRPSSGLQIAIGPNGWAFAKRDRRIILVLPFDEDPQDYCWPKSEPAIVHERGMFDDNRLVAMAKTLLEAGAPFVVGLREALPRPDVYFYPEVNYVTG